MKERKMNVKCYGKSELAHLYFPELEIKSAVRRLMRWITRCTDLMEELLKVNYQPRSQIFSAKEVRLIIFYLGEP